MAGQGPGAFPLLVRGDWGAAEPPPALRKKLLCYFQSQKRSGGGECDLRAGTASGDLLVCFARPEDKLPVQWEDMQEKQVKLVNLKPSCQEYLDLQDKFKKTSPNFAIEKNIYSKPDTNDSRYMYLAQVLTRQYCAANKGLMMPPPKKPADPTDRCGSVVDDVNNPTVFVVFNDHEAYPEYLITFTK